jgi:hypothetical protein
MKKIAGFFLSIVLACLISAGCSTISEKRLPQIEGLASKGSVTVSCYDDMADMKVQLLTKRLMIMALYDGKPDKDETKMIQQVESQELKAADLMPGKYYLRISGWKDENGKLNTSKSRDYKFTVEPGKETLVSVIITDYMKSGILVGGVVVGAVTIATVIFSVVLVMALIAAI